MSLVKKQFKTASWGNEKWGFIYRPTVPGKYPLIIFFHGMGESGTNSATAESLTAFGPLAFVKQGWEPPYVIVAIQAQYWSPEVDQYKYIIKNDPDVVSSWDGKNVLWTGLSAGGQRVLDAASKEGGVFVPMSAAASTALFDFTKTYKVWAFHDPKDTITPLVAVKPLYDKLKVKFTTTNFAHGNWNAFYDPIYTENGQNIYEWSFDGIVPDPLPVPGTRKVVQTLTLYNDNTYTNVLS